MINRCTNAHFSSTPLLLYSVCYRALILVSMKRLDNISTMDDLRYSFDWLTFCKSFPKLNKITNQADNAFLLDTRITDSVRLCQIFFLKEKEKIGMLFFKSGFGRNFQKDLTDQILNIKEVANNDNIVFYSANAL